jgi:hypothetical protein
MPTKVYLDGKNNVIVSKTGSDTLTIPVDRAKYTLQGTYPIADIEDYTQVRFMNLLTGETITDDTDKIQDSAGAFVGTTLDVKNYLEGFMNLGDTQALQEEVCTKANQEIIISQNEDIDSKLNTLNITQEDTQDQLKKELKENNRLLRKIYN